MPKIRVGVVKILHPHAMTPMRPAKKVVTTSDVINKHIPVQGPAPFKITAKRAAKKTPKPSPMKRMAKRAY